MAFVFTPQAPIADWLADLDAAVERSKSFFASHHVALDLSAVQLSPIGIAHLIEKLRERNIRVLGIEGAEISAEEATKLPPRLRGGQRTQDFDLSELGTPAANSAPPSPSKQQAASLLIEDRVRSGQSVVFMEGDVTVLGSVASGAEVIAGGSIHIYGALRGQAMAGAVGNHRARIFSHRFEAELVAISGYYRAIDEIDPRLNEGPAQAWVDGDTLKISAMN